MSARTTAVQTIPAVVRIGHDESTRPGGSAATTDSDVKAMLGHALGRTPFGRGREGGFLATSVPF
jgi:hypothetical protein